MSRSFIKDFIFILIACFAINVFAEDQAGCVWLGKDMKFKTDPSDMGISEEWFSAGFDDSAWDEIDSGKSYEKQGYANYDGVSWYRKSFYVPPEWNGKRINLEVGRVEQSAKLYINGESLGTLNGWWMNLGVSSKLNFGQINHICFRVTNDSGDGGLTRDPMQLILLTPDLRIGFSSSLPVINKSLEITVYENGAANQSISILKPDSNNEILQLNDSARVSWIPQSCGKHIVTYGKVNKVFWVTSKQLMFHYWDASVLPEYITHTIYRDPKLLRKDYWKNRGVELLAYGYGYGHEGKTSEQINGYWGQSYGRSYIDGFVVDEMCIDLREMQIALAEALNIARQQKGPDFEICPYMAGIGYDSHYGFWQARKAKAKSLWENYWGDEDLYLRRWLDLKYMGMDELGGVLCISPGFIQGNINGSLDPDQLRDEFARIRRLAPEMSGLGFFNGYYRRDLDELCSRYIEDFFLKPILHARPKNGNLEIENIGNQDSVSGIVVTFYQKRSGVEDLCKGNATLPVLGPGETTLIDVPSSSTYVIIDTPAGMENLYINKRYELPSNLYPLQVTSCSVDFMEEFNLEAENQLTIDFAFNKDILYANSAISLYRTQDYVVSNRNTDYVTHNPSNIYWNSATKVLSITYSNLPSGNYSIGLESGLSAFRDTAGNPLDGSGDGICSYSGGKLDHYTNFFSVASETPEPVNLEENLKGQAPIKLTFK